MAHMISAGINVRVSVPARAAPAFIPSSSLESCKPANRLVALRSVSMSSARTKCSFQPVTHTRSDLTRLRAPGGRRGAEVGRAFATPTPTRGRNTPPLVRCQTPNFLPFKEAREYLRSQNLGSKKEWQQWCKGGERPPNIPSHPERTYKNTGWVSWHDFIGNEFLPFEKAREYARSLNLGSEGAWQQWIKDGGRPSNIPSTPDKIYKDKLWVSWQDWLGGEL